MNLTGTILDAYGVRIRNPPADGAFRSFKIDELHNGFVMAFDDCAVFGSIIHGERCILCDDLSCWYRSEHKASKKIQYEWLVWESARSMLERGERLSAVDRERLALAVKRLEEWL